VQKESFHFVATLLTFFCLIEGAWGEAVVVVVSFCSPFEQIVKKLILQYEILPCGTF
jgi:hypothetical protein